MSCGQIALRELGISVDAYYASEIDKFCIAQTRLNFPAQSSWETCAVWISARSRK